MKSFALFALITATCCLWCSAQTVDVGRPDFSKADSIAELYAAHSLYDLAGLAVKLTAPLPSEEEKFRAIYKWVCSNIEVDYALVTLNKRKREKLTGEKLASWNQKFSKLVFNRLLEQQKTLCTGYAYTIRELCFHAGLTCNIVNGYANPRGIEADKSMPLNHSWNVVRINNRWYASDATWSSGFISRTDGEFKKRFNDQYFLADEAVFSKDHIALE